MSPKARDAAPSHEVRCPDCNVSFPVGTRRCVHCGGRTAAAPSAGPEGSAGLSVPPPLERDEEGLEAGSSRVSRGLGVVWVLLAVAISLYRVCTGAR